jgi:hypothetical protein
MKSVGIQGMKAAFFDQKKRIAASFAYQKEGSCFICLSKEGQLLLICL